ncbi:MAG: hypothetical protein LBI81_03410 [Puniceicoccales bacterium]|jgi:hypothetical protein|nr:hypothetical protein [Puniceicoccales bacterium]
MNANLNHQNPPIKPGPIISKIYNAAKNAIFLAGKGFSALVGEWIETAKNLCGITSLNARDTEVLTSSGGGEGVGNAEEKKQNGSTSASSGNSSTNLNEAISEIFSEAIKANSLPPTGSSQKNNNNLPFSQANIDFSSSGSSASDSVSTIDLSFLDAFSWGSSASNSVSKSAPDYDIDTEIALGQSAVEAYLRNSENIFCEDDEVLFLISPSIDLKAPSIGSKTGNTSARNVQEDSARRKSFGDVTGVNPSDCDRVVVDMSGNFNFCGYNTILSQSDPTMAGNALSYGGSKEMAEETTEKVAQLRLAIAIGKVNKRIGNGERFDRNGVEAALKEEMIKLGYGGDGRNGASLNGMLEADDIKYISPVLGKRILVVSSREGEVQDFPPNGKHICYSDNPPPSGEITFEEGDARKVLQAAMKDPNVIIMYNLGSVHFVSVQPK